MTSTHAAAGTYYPATPGARTLAEVAPLMVQGMRVSAQVAYDGTYTVFAGGEVAATGSLDGTEGDLMVFFTAEALVWSAGIDAQLEENAAAELAAFDRHMNETGELAAEMAAPKTVEEIIEMVERLGGYYRVLRADHTERYIPASMVLKSLRNSAKFPELVIEVKDAAGDRFEWYIQVSNGKGSGYGQWMFAGHDFAPTAEQMAV